MLQGTHMEKAAPHRDEGPISYPGGGHTQQRACHPPRGSAHRAPTLADSP